MSSLYKLGYFIRVGSIESIEHVGAFARVSCILRVNKIRVGVAKRLE